MKLHKLLLAFFACLFFVNINAEDLTGVRIYINPGHGGFNGANDRNIKTIPFNLGDEDGFWESSSNLTKGLALRDLLEANGAFVMMSRTLNREEDDRNLTEIAEEASANNMDAFLSIHSNGIGTNTGTNYLLMLYRGTDATPDPAASRGMAEKAWDYMYDNALTNWTYYSATNKNVRGDWSFYGYHLGVLRQNTVPGFLSEGEFHDYKPETHRLLNTDYKKLEAYRFYRYFCDYFTADLNMQGGVLAGVVKSTNEHLVDPNYIFKAGTNDQWKPVNAATVELYDTNDQLVNTYTTDNYYNGVFVFYNLAPGTYKVKIAAEDYENGEVSELVVEAGKTTSFVTQIENKTAAANQPIPQNYKDPEQELGVIAMPHYKTTEVSATLEPWYNKLNIRRAVQHKDKLYVLTTDPRILVVNPETGDSITELKTTGITGGDLILSDIKFSADDYLVACNKDTIDFGSETDLFKVYYWEDDDAEPALLLSSNQQGNWYHSVIGETFAISGPIWKCEVYTGGVTTSSTKRIRFIGYTVDKDMPDMIGYNFMDNGNDFSTVHFGENYSFTMSPRDKNSIIVDGEKIQPKELKFPWGSADRTPMTIVGEMANDAVANEAGGATFFKYAKHSFMIAPTCAADSTNVNAILLDITDGLDQAKTISSPILSGETGKASYMTANAIVNGYDIDFYLMSQGQGMAKYTTVTNEGVANVYAYDLRLTQTAEGNSKFDFALNENATEVIIELTNTEGEIIKSFAQGALSKGVNSVTIAKVDIPFGEFYWQIKASASSIVRPIRMTGDDEIFQYYAPYGLAIDKNTESDRFGRIYISNSRTGTCGSGRHTDQGIYVLDPLFQDVLNQNGTAFGTDYFNAGSSSSPFRLSLCNDGRLFVSDWNDSHSGIYIMDTENPGTFTDLYEGSTRESNGLRKNGEGIALGGSSPSCVTVGSGENTILYVFDEDYEVNGTKNNILKFNLGTANTVTSAPEVYFENGANGTLQLNGNSTILPDEKGGMWISQYRSADQADIPCLIHFNGTAVDYNSGATDPLVIKDSKNGGMAISKDGKRIAMGGNNAIRVLDITYNEQGIPQVSRLYEITPAIGSKSNSLDFDYAGNLYIVSNSGERIAMWTLPNAENTCTTPAQRSQVISRTPETVTNLRATVTDNNDVQLDWDVVTVENATIEYNVYVENEKVATVSENTYLDEAFRDGTIHYAISVVVNGVESSKANVSATVDSITDQEAINTTSAYPNPTAGRITIKTHESIVNIQVYNLHGQLMNQYEGLGMTEQSIDLSSLNTGTYIVHINGKQSIRVIRK